VTGHTIETSTLYEGSASEDFANQDEIENDGGTAEEYDGDIKEDTLDNWDESSSVKNEISKRLQEAGVDAVTEKQVHKILDANLDQLIRIHLASVGVKDSNLSKVAHMLKPINLYLKRLEDLGLTKEKH